MKYKKRIILLSLLAPALFGLWWCSDLGRGYEEISLHRNSTYTVSDGFDVSFAHHSNHVVEYVIGSKPSRMTTAHGYRDRILIEFQEDPDSLGGYCKIINASRTGYRRSSPLVIRSLDDVWLTIRSCDDYYYIKGAIRLTHPNDKNPGPESGEVVYISYRKID